MHLDYFYKREDIVSIDAAVVGISKSDWEYLPEERAELNEAKKIMREKRYDVLPIVSKKGDVHKYFVTENWNNFDNISTGEVSYEAVIPYNTSIRTVIKELATDNRLFFFLSAKNDISGLISYVNLNCRQVKIYLFSLISELEIKLGELIVQSLDEKYILPELKEDTKESYLEDMNRGSEPTLIEYLYLSEMLNIIRKSNLVAKVGYPSKTKFDNYLGRINSLRHKVAHPSKSLVTSSDSVSKLWDKILIIEKALFNLRRSS